MLKSILLRLFISLFLISFLLVCPRYTLARSATKKQISQVKRGYEPDIWKAIGDNINLYSYRHNYFVQKQIRWLLANPKSLLSRTQNAEPYIYFITQEIKKRKMPLELALLPMIESNYNPNQISSAKATGLWQLMPTTALGLGVRINRWYDGRRDIIVSTRAALEYLNYLHHTFNSWPLVFAAYNAGMGTVTKAINHNKAHQRSENYWNLQLPSQTRQYVPKLLAIALILSHPERYHIAVKKVHNRRYFTGVKVSSPLTFRQLAKLSHTSVSMLHLLNPGFIKSKPEPQRSYYLLVPSNRAITFKTNLTAYLAQKNKKYDTLKTYFIKKGDTLSGIALKHHTSSKQLRTLNHLNSDYIRAGQIIYTQ